MCAEDLRSVRDSSDHHPFFSKDASIPPIWQGRPARDGNAHVSFPSAAQPSCDLVATPVNVTKYFNKFCSILDAGLFAAMYQDGKRV